MHFRQGLHRLHPPLLFAFLSADGHRPVQGSAEQSETDRSEDHRLSSNLELLTAEMLQELQRQQISPEDYCHGTLASAVSLLLACLSRDAPTLQEASDLVALLLGLVGSVTELLKVALKKGRALAREEGRRSGVSLLHSLLLSETASEKL